MSATVDTALAEIVRREPRLDALLVRARAASMFRRRDPWPQYSRLKSEMSTLVGWSRPDGDPVLSTSESYDVVLRALIDALGV